MAEFARRIRTNQEPQTGPEVPILVVDVPEPIIESAETCRPVDVR
jgi:predicted dehydrogenase